MLQLISQFGLVVSAVYLVLTTVAAYRQRGRIRILTGAAGGLFALACVLYLGPTDVRVDLFVTAVALCTLLVPIVLVRPQRLTEPRPKV